MSQGSFINTQLNQIRTPLVSVQQTSNEYTQIAELISKGLGITASVINANTQNTEQQTAAANIEVAKQVATARFKQSEKDAEDNLVISGYKFESEQLRQQAAVQEADLPKMLEAAGGSYTKVLEQNPGLLRPVRNKVQNVLAQQKAEADLAQFRALSILRPNDNIQDVAQEFLQLKQNSYPEFDQETKGQYFGYIQDAINRDVALKTVTLAENQRRDAIDAGDQHLLDNLTALKQGGLLTNDTFGAIGQKYIQDSLGIDNRRSETVLRAQTYAALKSVLVDDSNISAQSAQETFDKLFPKDAQGRNTTPLGSELEISLASALQSQITAKQQAESARKINIFQDGLKADPSHFNIVKQFLNSQGSPNWTQNEKDSSKFILAQQSNQTILSELDSVQTREGLKTVSDRAEAYRKTGIFTDDQFITYKVKEQAKFSDLESRFKVQDVINKVQGWQDISLDTKADKWINLHVEGLMQPQIDATGKPIANSGMPLNAAYSYMVETFGKLTPDFISGLDDLANSPGVGTGDPNQDFRTKYQRLSDAAAVFASLKTSAPGYINQLISEKKISGKLQAIVGAVDILGDKPDNVSLYLAGVPKDAFTEAEANYSKPPKGMNDSITTIRDSFGDGIFTLAPDTQGISENLVSDYKSLYLYNYGLLWARSNGGMTADQLSISASKSAADALKKPDIGYSQNFGNFKNVVQPRYLPTSMQQSNVELMSNVWDKVLEQAEGAGLNINPQTSQRTPAGGFENIRYGTTNINTDRFSVSDDGKYYQFDVYQTDKPSGKLAPVAKFLWPIDEVAQKELADKVSVSTYQQSFDVLDTFDYLFNGPRTDTMKMRSARNEVFKQLFVPYKVETK